MKLSRVAVATIASASLALVACQPKTESVEKAQTEKAAEAKEFNTEAEKQAYALGASMGLYINNRKTEYDKFAMELDTEAALQGFKDGVADEVIYAPEELQAIAQAADASFREKQAEQGNAQAEQNLAEGQAYLAENAQKEGVMTTESGLQYEVLEEGDGPKPSAEDTVKVHYEGRLLDGTVFDSSYARDEPAVFPLSRVIAGWTEGVQLMQEGAKYRFHIKPELAYGNRATGKITRNSTLVFDVELLEVVSDNASE
ncbi:FKBP-type peptidyl-prolyl cis-trans isomerase [Alteromonas oceanisediminis]|uniref:FKBP-type peptidyl-prolyl cis-trans isomerase n=1 Tax=Alteromonas oceanisediminis TaxID=2836180 RepID=UPI001BDACE52|nr:FKBP-type peptidyl-prolyl cis-trans isomerase [Alteromonas oceanisediminis]MBT0586199.1 FKBP-type peptidyl-prolyl cis-trans isomerase [Alteromonas oceanisediminis]